MWETIRKIQEIVLASNQFHKVPEYEMKLWYMSSPSNWSIFVAKHERFIPKKENWVKSRFYVISEKIPSLKLIIDVDFSIYNHFYTQILIFLYGSNVIVHFALTNYSQFDQPFALDWGVTPPIATSLPRNSVRVELAVAVICKPNCLKLWLADGQHIVPVQSDAFYWYQVADCIINDVPTNAHVSAPSYKPIVTSKRSREFAFFRGVFLWNNRVHFWMEYNVSLCWCYLSETLGEI